MEIRTLRQESLVEVMKAVPAVGGGLWAVITSSQMVAAVTVLYVVLQGAHLLWKWYHEWKEKR